MAQSKIQNADIRSNAAIDVSKLAAGTDGYVLTTTAGVPGWAPASGGPGGGGFTQYNISTSTSYSSDTDNLVVSITAKPSGADTNITLPSATTNGQLLVVQDATGIATESLQYFITLTPDNTDTIDGINKRHVLTSDSGFVMLISDGAGAWRTVSFKGGWGVDPRSISGIKIWSMAERVFSNKSTAKDYLLRVPTLPNCSGNALDFSQPTAANRPRLIPNGWAGQPGLGFLASAGTFMETANTSWSNQQFSVIMVASYSNHSGVGMSYNAGSSAGFLGFRGPFIPSVNLDAILFTGGSADTLAAGGAMVGGPFTRHFNWHESSSTPVLGVRPVIFSAKATANTTTGSTLAVNGYGDGSRTSTNFLAGTNSGKPITLGASRFNGSIQGALSGIIYEVIAYDVNISSADYYSLLRYCSNKYDIQIGAYTT